MDITDVLDNERLLQLGWGAHYYGIYRKSCGPHATGPTLDQANDHYQQRITIIKDLICCRKERDLQ